LELIELKANTRTKTGKGPARVLRCEGSMPAILYGPDTTPVLLSISTKDLENALKQGASGHLLFNLDTQKGDNSSYKVMIKELQTHPVSREFLHVDFYEINMDRKIRVNVPVVVTGKSVGVEMGGLLQIVRRELEVLCLPMEIPEPIEIDITDLDIGDSIHVKEIPLEGNIEMPTDVNFTVLTILSPTKEEEVEEEELEEGMEEMEGEGEADESEDEA